MLRRSASLCGDFAGALAQPESKHPKSRQVHKALVGRDQILTNVVIVKVLSTY